MHSPCPDSSLFLMVSNSDSTWLRLLSTSVMTPFSFPFPSIPDEVVSMEVVVVVVVDDAGGSDSEFALVISSVILNDHGV